MKYLIHSRKFKSVLFKWLFCYIGIMALFTAVVTYSRYISSRTMNDDARVALFKVTISPVNPASLEDGLQQCNVLGTQCDYGSIKSREHASAYFRVDTTNLEVKTIMVTSITVDSHFNNPVLYYRNSGGGWVQLPNESYPGIGVVIDGNSITITETIVVNNGTDRIYKVECDYVDYESNYGVGGSYEIVKVGYSAKQEN